MLAVLRGGFSEGANLSDASCRGVVIAGLPLLPLSNAKVKLKRSFLDGRITANTGAIGALSGESWYRRQATLLVNQALGRAIRHSDDYGAVLICESRFSSHVWSRELSTWALPVLQNFPSFTEAKCALEAFFAQHSTSLVASAPKLARRDKRVVPNKRLTLHEALGERSDYRQDRSAGPVPVRVPVPLQQGQQESPQEQQELLEELLSSSGKIPDLKSWLMEFEGLMRTACSRLDDDGAQQSLQFHCAKISAKVARIADGMVTKRRIAKAALTSRSTSAPSSSSTSTTGAFTSASVKRSWPY